MPRTHGAYSQTSPAPALARVWQSMRVLRRFSSGDLITTAEADATAVRKYVRALHQAGYLRLLQARVSGRPGSRDQWALARDSGPLAPIRRRDGSGVFDANAHIVWNLQGQVVRDLTPLPQPNALSLAEREALRLLHADGAVRASVATLRTLARKGLVRWAAELTDSGRVLAAELRVPASQKAGAA